MVKSGLISLSSYRVLRFGIVGVANTLLNFIILNLAFYKLGVGKITANIIATCCALVFSFILNRKFVFAHKGHWLKSFITFAVVTAIGTLIINNGVYILALAALKNHVSHDVSSWISGMGLKLSPDFIDINGSAIIATLFSMVWNYTGYRKIVFTEKADVSDEAAV